MNCPKCGRPLAPDAKFCAVCGFSIPAAAAAQPYLQQPYQGQPYQQPYRGQPYQGQPYPQQPYQGQPYPQQPYQRQPYPQQPPAAPAAPAKAEKKSNRGLVAVIIILALLLLLGAAAAVLYFVDPFGWKALQWTEWSEDQIEEMTSPAYETETRTLYRSREKETTTSDKDTMDGWTLYDTVTTGGGEWSEWGTTELTATDKLEVETQTRYRCSKKEYTTSSSSSMSGWTCYKTDSSSSWGAWSDWSTIYVSGTSTRQVETKTQYRYRDRYYDDYGGWYAESWSSWSDSYPSSGYNREIDSRTMYRSRTKSTSTTYYYERWGAWSDWGTTEIAQSDTCKVETAVYYRSREAAETTYYFYRWGEWSDYSEEEIKPTDDLEVDTKTEYRCRKKQ